MAIMAPGVRGINGASHLTLAGFGVVTRRRTDVVYDELDKLSDFMMIRLCEYANGGGCVYADYGIRHGKVRDEIVGYLEETQPDLLVLGRPGREADEDAPPAFESEMIVRFAEEITKRRA